VPLAWTNVNNLANKINPQQKEKTIFDSSRQTVELRTPDGSANVHLLLAGITMATDWGLTNAKESLNLAELSNSSMAVDNCKTSGEIGELSTSCAESAEKLLAVRTLYEKNGIFPPNVINQVANLLMAENDRYLNNRLLSLPEDERLIESRRIMHRDIHRC
jgi:glutamine synthetase